MCNAEYIASALKLIENPEFHQRSKHIDVKYHFLRDLYNKSEVDVTYRNSVWCWPFSIFFPSFLFFLMIYDRIHRGKNIYLEYYTTVVIHYTCEDKLAYVLKLKKVTFLDTQKFYDRLILKIVILHLRFPLHGKLPPSVPPNRLPNCKETCSIDCRQLTSARVLDEEALSSISSKTKLWIKNCRYISIEFRTKNHPRSAHTTIFDTPCILFCLP